MGLPGPYELHPREYYTYRLRGVVVHRGTANQGHYFSYIRDPELGNTAAKSKCYPARSPTATTELDAPTCGRGIAEEGSSARDHGSGGDLQSGPETKGVVPDGGVVAEVKEEDQGPRSSVDTRGHETGVVESAAGVRVATATAAGSAQDAGGGAGCEFTRAHEAEQEKEGKWCEFNDTIVKEWSIGGKRGAEDVSGAEIATLAGLEVECFGGQQTMQVSVQ